MKQKRVKGRGKGKRGNKRREEEGKEGRECVEKEGNNLGT